MDADINIMSFPDASSTAIANCLVVGRRSPHRIDNVENLGPGKLGNSGELTTMLPDRKNCKSSSGRYGK